MFLIPIDKDTVRHNPATTHRVQLDRTIEFSCCEIPDYFRTEFREEVDWFINSQSVNVIGSCNFKGYINNPAMIDYFINNHMEDKDFVRRYQMKISQDFKNRTFTSPPSTTYKYLPTEITCPECTHKFIHTELVEDECDFTDELLYRCPNCSEEVQVEFERLNG